jgi:hypothetical protein
MTPRSILLGATLGAAAVMLSGCLVLGAAGAVGGAAVAVTGAAVGVAGTAVGVAAKGAGAVVGAVVPGSKKDDKSGS